jgi:hypothetical protein
MKLVVDGTTDRVLGCHIVGDTAAEIVQAVAIAVKMKATKADFDATIALHPTAAEELVTMRTPTARHVRQAAGVGRVRSPDERSAIRPELSHMSPRLMRATRLNKLRPAR